MSIIHTTVHKLRALLFATLALLLCLAGAGTALAAPAAVSDLTSPSPPGSADPVFTWSPMRSIAGYSYELDQIAMNDPDSSVDLDALAFASNANVAAGARPWGIVVDDFNGDGKDDLASTSWDDNTVTVALGDGMGGFTTATFAVGEPADPVLRLHSIAAGHIDSDAHLDLAVTARAGAKVYVALGDGSGGFSTPTGYSFGVNPKQLVVKDFNGDTYGDVAVASNGDHGVNVRLANSNGTLAAMTHIATDEGAEAIAVGKFNADGYHDLAVAHKAANLPDGTKVDGTVTILLGNGAGGFTAGDTMTVGKFPHDLSVGDIDNDGKRDMAVANYSSNSVSLLMGVGDGTFTQPPNIANIAQVPAAAIAATDFSGDGLRDLAVADWNVDRVVILFGNGDGTFDEDPLNISKFDVGDAPNNMAVGDFDSNGMRDIAVAQSGSGSASVGVLLNETANPPSAKYTDLDPGTWYFHVRAVDTSGTGGPTSHYTVNVAKPKPAVGTPVPPTSVGRGKTFTVSGTLKPRFPAGENTVRIRLYRKDDGVWKYIRTYDAVNSNYSTYTKYKAKISLTRRAKYRFKAVAPETGDWARSVSAYSKTMTVKRVAAIYTPRVPTAVSAGQRFTVWSYLKPRFPAGQKTVRVKLYRYRNGKWNYVRTYAAVNSNYSSFTKFKVRIRLTTKAKYRFKAYMPETSTWVRTTSKTSKTMTVR